VALYPKQFLPLDRLMVCLCAHFPDQS